VSSSANRRFKRRVAKDIKKGIAPPEAQLRIPSIEEVAEYIMQKKQGIKLEEPDKIKSIWDNEPLNLNFD
tara:strand:- start:35 stop:244 length:210 start_codon:yes stop_codon:yes gene_type:complete